MNLVLVREMVFTFYVPVVLCLLSRRCINYWRYPLSTIKAMRRDHGGTNNVRVSETSAYFYETARRNIPENCRLQMNKRNRRFEDHLGPHHQGCDVIPEPTVPLSLSLSLYIYIYIYIYSSPVQYAKTIRRRTNGKRRPSRDRITTPPACRVLAGHYYNEWPGGAIYSVFQKSLYR
jgi:hypothetical protein